MCGLARSNSCSVVERACGQNHRAKQNLSFQPITLDAIWYVVVGIVFAAMALAASLVQRLPLSTAILYLAVGLIIGPHGWSLLNLNPVLDAKLIERVAEMAVIVSLFAAGLKLRVPWRDRRWLLPLRLAFGTMAMTVK